jgi:hypothetical protein
MFDINGKLVSKRQESNEPDARPAWGARENGANP